MASSPVNCGQGDLAGLPRGSAGSPRGVDLFPDESFDESFSREGFFRKYCQETNWYTKGRLEGLSNKGLKAVEAAIQEKQSPSTGVNLSLGAGVLTQIEPCMGITSFKVQDGEEVDSLEFSFSLKPYDRSAPIAVPQDKDLGEYGRGIAKHGMRFETHDEIDRVTVQIGKKCYTPLLDRVKSAVSNFFSVQ